MTPQTAQPAPTPVPSSTDVTGTSHAPILGIPDWRIWFGVGLTLLWLLLGSIYVSSTIGWGTFVGLPAAELGNFLEGAFAPLAFLWLVIGYFLQQKELQQNTDALRAQAIEIKRSAEQAAIQSEKMAATEIQARQQTYLQIAESVRSQLGSIGGLLYFSVHPANNVDSPERSEIGELFNRMGNEDNEVFSRMLLTAHLRLSSDPKAQLELFYGTEVRARHTNNFIFTYDRLMERAADVDEDNMLRDAFRACAHGFIYTVMRRHQANAPPEWADYTLTGTHINW